jgi:dTDP-4-amino-4,6-dideoxygalactose transaminase
MGWKVPLADLDYDANEFQAALDVLHSKWLTMGAVTQAFEAEFAAHHHVKHAIAVSNATQALHLACLALGIGPGDEVIVPSLTFVATSNAVLYTGAEPRFADITSLEDPTLDPADVEAKITPRTKAIICMHYAGYPCYMHDLKMLAQQKGLALIEDSAHAPGAWLSGIAMGTWGDVGCFSFFSNKNLSTGEGGMVVTDRDEIATKVRQMRSHGMTSLTWDRHQGHAYSYDVVTLGYNDRIDEIRSALGRVQLRKLHCNNICRGVLTNKYWNALKNCGLTLPFYKTYHNCFRADNMTAFMPAHHILPVLLPQGVDRSTFVENLKQEGIQTSLHYPPIHTFSYYKERFGEQRIPLTEEYAAREVTLPLWSGLDLNEEYLQEIIGALQVAAAH